MPPYGWCGYTQVVRGNEEVNTIPKTSSIAQAGETTSVQQVDNKLLGTLATNTGILEAGPVMTASGKLLSLRGSFTWHDITAGDGPVAVFVVDNSLSLAEFEEYIEAGGPVSPEDTTAAERATRGRRVRDLGLLVPSGNGTVAGLFLRDFPLKGLRFSAGKAGWSFIFYNRGKALTDASVVRFQLSAFLQWAKTTV